MMSSDNTSYVASEDHYMRVTAAWDACWYGPFIAKHAVEEQNQVGSCRLEHLPMAVTYSSPLFKLDECRWQQSVFPGKTLSEVDQGASKDSLLLSRLLHMDESPGCNDSKRNSGSGQYMREISASNDPYSLVSCSLHEKSPADNSSKEESSSSQYAIKEIRPSNDPSLLLSRLLHEEIPRGNSTFKENSISTQYGREICATNDPSLLLSRLLHEESPACNSFKEDSASTQYARELCATNNPSLLLSGLLHEKSPSCNSSKEDSASNLYAKELCASNDPSLLLSDLLQEGSPGCNSSQEDSPSSLYPEEICASNDPFLLLSRLLLKEIPGCNSSKEDSASSRHAKELSVSERWNEKFTKVTKESTMKCSEAISSCADLSQQASGVELRNVDFAPTYLLPGEGEELVVIEDFFVVVGKDSNSRGRNVKICCQRSENEDFENEVEKFHEITSRDWSLNTESGVEVEETIHDEFSGNRAVMKSKAKGELLDDWLIL
ncbi:hypothetical protein O6H91_23G023400 [Diphasiastrum complanatum]|uniref:Uncharacterized protein n=1 Tax=Diphasiastrum complanatum TaxID=34168 RepID=A0ACC2A900_DIPCM|nr:hypothetical protein O6H91_23G023400 [Diphasiastrum complanatum]